MTEDSRIPDHLPDEVLYLLVPMTSHANMTQLPVGESSRGDDNETLLMDLHNLTANANSSNITYGIPPRFDEVSV